MKDFVKYSTAELVKLKAKIEWEIDWRAVQKRVNRREVVGYFTACGGDERFAEFEFHLGFTDGTKERWDFRHSFTDTARAMMETFRKSFFPTVKEITWEKWAEMGKQKRK